MSRPAKNPALLGAFLLVFAISLGVLGGFRWFMLSHAHRVPTTLARPRDEHQVDG